MAIVDHGEHDNMRPWNMTTRSPGTSTPPAYTVFSTLQVDCGTPLLQYCDCAHDAVRILSIFSSHQGTTSTRGRAFQNCLLVETTVSSASILVERPLHLLQTYMLNGRQVICIQPSESSMPLGTGTLHGIHRYILLKLHDKF